MQQRRRQPKRPEHRRLPAVSGDDGPSGEGTTRGCGTCRTPSAPGGVLCTCFRRRYSKQGNRRSADVVNRRPTTIRVAGILAALLIASIALLPDRVLAGSAGGNGSVIVTGGTSYSNGSGSNQSNVGAAQSVGQVGGQISASTCIGGPLAPAGPGSAGASTTSGSSTAGGSASAGTATGGTVISGNAVGGNATGGNATGGNATGASVTGGNAGGPAAPGKPSGGPAVGGSAVGGSAIGGALATCAVATPPGGMAPLNQANDNALLCGTVASNNGSELTISTVTGPVNIAVPTGTTIVGTIPTSGNACLLLTSTNGVLIAIHVLTCHGSTSGTVELAQVPADNNAALPGSSACGQLSLHTNTVTSSNGSTSTVQISLDCPDPCAPTPVGASASGSLPLPTPTTPPQVSPGLPIVLPNGSNGATPSNSPSVVTLQLGDLPTGFQQTTFTSLDNAQVAQGWHTTLAAVESSGHVAAFESTFQGSANSSDLAVGDRVDLYRSGSMAHLSFAATARTMIASFQTHHVRGIKSVGVGKESIQFALTTSLHGAKTTTITLLFRRDRDVATITLHGLPAVATAQRARALAQALDTRIRSTH